MVSYSLFEGGRNEADVRRTRARRDEASANYRETALTAFWAASTALDDLCQRAGQAAAQKQVVEDARAVLSFSIDRHNHQTPSYFQVVIDQAVFLPARLNAARTRNARYATAVSLAFALGDGWAGIATPTLP